MHVIFLAPHFPAGQRGFVRGLKAVGARVTGIGDAPLSALDGELKALLDGYEEIRHIGDEDEMFRAVRRIQQRGPWVHYFEATIESHMNVAARVRERAGIPGLSPAVVERCRDKFVMKRFLAERGIPCAAHAEVDDRDDLVAFVGRVGFPIILKPRDAAGAHGTYKISNEAELRHVTAETGLDRGGRSLIAEEFIEGHEGFFDTITIDGTVRFEAITHYYPNVLTAMRTRGVSPYLVTTNRIDSDGYEELRHFGRKVIRNLGIGTAATHMEWFYGPKGLKFSEIGARPPGVNFWDVYAAAGEFDIYAEWARARCWADLRARGHVHRCGALLNLRPTADGVIRGYSGVDAVQAKYGHLIQESRLPPAGTRTQPVEAGFLANAWMTLVHPDYDELRGICEEIGRTITVHAG